MQHAGWKTSEKAISVELLHGLQDFALKSLFNTLFMMFNSRYKGFTIYRVCPQPPDKGLAECTIIKGMGAY